MMVDYYFNIMNKEYFLNKIKQVYSKPFKMRFIKKGKYGTPECWLYPIENPRYQKQVFKNGKTYNLVDADHNPIMESRTGVLVEVDTLENTSYLKEYLESCL